MDKNLVKKYSKPLISIVMSVYNGEKYLKEAIESILNQTFVNFEFIIINDGSTDNSLKIIKNYNDPRIVLISRENKGLVASLNEAIKLAKGKYIARQDADDISHPSRLEKEYEHIFSDKNTKLVCSYIKEIDLSGKEYKKRRIMSNEISSEFIESSLLAFNPIAHGSVMFEKDAFYKAGEYDSNFFPAEDYELWTRMARIGNMTVIREKLYFFRVNPKGISLSMSADQIEKVKEIQIKYMKNHLKRSRNIKITQETIDIYLNNHLRLSDRFAVKLLKLRVKIYKNALPNILIVNNSENIGGGEMYVKQILNSLSGDYNLSTMVKKELSKKMELVNSKKNILYPKFLDNYQYRIINKLRPLLAKLVIKINNIEDFDIVHFQQLNESLLNSIKKPTKIFTMHSELKSDGSESKNIRRLLNLNDSIICVSKSLTNITKKLKIPQEKINIIYNGVDGSRLEKLNTSDRSKKIVWVGRVDKADKNPRLFLEIAKKSIIMKKDYVFMIYGVGDYVDEIKKSLEKEEIDNLKIMGFEKDKKNIFQNSLATCITSDREAMPLVMLESFASGIPVVTTMVGDSSEIFNKYNPGIIANRNAKSFIESIDIIAKNWKPYSKNSKKAYHEMFTLNTMSNKLKNLYDEVLR